MVILGLGSNIGDRNATLSAAIASLHNLMRIESISSVVETPALLPQGAPDEWNIAFLNLALVGHTNSTPEVLLTEIKALEKQLGRKDRGHWAPREIDIDILAWDDVVLDSQALSIPHLQLPLRKFVLVPLSEIAPTWQYPRQGKHFGQTAVQMLAALQDAA